KDNRDFMPARINAVARGWYGYGVGNRDHVEGAEIARWGTCRQPTLKGINAMSAVFALTIFHVLVSLAAIVAGIPVVYGFLKNQVHPGWTTTYIITTALTLITSFLFPFNGFTPAIGVGILCILIFIPTVYAKYRTSLTGIWRLAYVVGSTALLYFNC